MTDQIRKAACQDLLKDKFEYLFDESLRKEMCLYGMLKVYKADSLIMDIGDNIEFMPLVLDGSIKVMTEDEEENELLLYYLEAGDTCAVTLNCCTNRAKSSIRAFAESDVELLFIPAAKMEDWMIYHKSWRSYVLESYNTRLNEMLKALDSIVFNSMEERLQKYLRDKAWVTKSSTLLISHQDIANDLHSSRVVVSRLMKKLEQSGLIKQSRNKIEYLEFSKSGE